MGGVVFFSAGPGMASGFVAADEPICSLRSLRASLWSKSITSVFASDIVSAETKMNNSIFIVSVLTYLFGSDLRNGEID